MYNGTIQCTSFDHPCGKFILISFIFPARSVPNKRTNLMVCTKSTSESAWLNIVPVLDYGKDINLSRFLHLHWSDYKKSINLTMRGEKWSFSPIFWHFFFIIITNISFLAVPRFASSRTEQTPANKYSSKSLQCNRARIPACWCVYLLFRTAARTNRELCAWRIT